MEKYANKSFIEKKIEGVLDWSPILTLGYHVLFKEAVDKIDKRFPNAFSKKSSKVEEIPTDNEDDTYCLEIFGLDVPSKILTQSLDHALEEVGRFADSDLSVDTQVEYAGPLYHLYAHVPELKGHPEGNFRSTSPIEDLSYFERNHVHDFWIKEDGSLYVAISVYSLPDLKNTKLPVSMSQFPSLDPKSFMGGLVDITIFDSIEKKAPFSIGKTMQIHLLPAKATFNETLLWHWDYDHLRDKVETTIGDEFPYYAVAVLRKKDKEVANLLLEKLQQELNGSSKEGTSLSKVS